MKKLLIISAILFAIGAAGHHINLALIANDMDYKYLKNVRPWTYKHKLPDALFEVFNLNNWNEHLSSDKPELNLKAQVPPEILNKYLSWKLKGKFKAQTPPAKLIDKSNEIISKSLKAFPSHLKNILIQKTIGPFIVSGLNKPMMILPLISSSGEEVKGIVLWDQEYLQMRPNNLFKNRLKYFFKEGSYYISSSAGGRRMQNLTFTYEIMLWLTLGQLIPLNQDGFPTRSLTKGFNGKRLNGFFREGWRQNQEKQFINNFKFPFESKEKRPHLNDNLSWVVKQMKRAPFPTVNSYSGPHADFADSFMIYGMRKYRNISLTFNLVRQRRLKAIITSCLNRNECKTKKRFIQKFDRFLIEEEKKEKLEKQKMNKENKTEEEKKKD